MSFVPKYLPLRDALAEVADRSKLPVGRQNPLVAALEEGLIKAELRRGVSWSILSCEEWCSLNIWWPSPVCRTFPEEGETDFRELRIESNTIENLWPSKPVISISGGRPDKWDWEGAAIEMARYANVEDANIPSRPQLNKLVAEWFVNTAGNHPAEGLIRDHVKRFHEAVWPPKT